MQENTIKQAVILAGGQGTRLRPLTHTLPKPMIPIVGKPFLEHLVSLLKKNKIEEILILVGYLHEKIIEYFRDGKKFGVKILYSHDSTESDTGTRVRNARKLLHEKFLLLYGDNYWPLKLKEMIRFYKKVGLPYLVTAYKNLDNSTKNNMYINEKGHVEIYDKSRQTSRVNGVDIGFFILKKDIVDLIPRQNSSFEKTVMIELLRRKQLAGYLTNHRYYSLTDTERIPMLEKYLQKRKVVFLDRDGVINK